MLFVNDVEVKPGVPQWKRYETFLKEVIPSLPDIVILKRSTPIKFNPTGLVEADPFMFVPYEAKDYDAEFGSQHWRYSETAPIKKETGKITYKPLGMNFKRYLAVDKKKQPDFLFFMFELSHTVKQGSIICEDKGKEARKLIEKDSKYTSVKYMIYDDSSPISPESTGGEALLRMIGSAWGVSKAHDKQKTIDEVRVELLGLVEQSEKNMAKTGRGYDIFMSEIKSKERLTLRANIQRAVDDKIIKYGVEDFTWRYVANGQPIMVVSSKFFNVPSSGLFAYFLREADKRKVFYGTLGNEYDINDEYQEVDSEPEKVVEVSEGDPNADTLKKEDTKAPSGDDVPEIELKPEDLADMPYRDMQKVGFKLGINALGMKKGELAGKIKEALAAGKLQEA